MQPLSMTQLREDGTIAAEHALTRGLLGDSRPKPLREPMSAIRNRRSKPLNVVLICHFGRTGYNILRSLKAVNARVYLVHDRRAASLGYSRRCKVVHATQDLGSADPDRVLGIINDLHLQIGLDSVIASDVESLAFLSKIRERLLAPVFPMADAGTLATLNDKWTFYKLCETAGVAVPKSLSVSCQAGLDIGAIERDLGYPVIVKPVNSYGQRGISILRNRTHAEEWKKGQADHDQPVIIQEYIEGMDWAISVFAQDGVIKHWVSWVCPSQLDLGYGIGRFLATEFRPHDDLFAMTREVIAATGFSGVANFDARYDDQACKMKMLECNPRFFNRMSAARLSGLDFVRPGLPVADDQPVTLGNVGYYPWQELFSTRGLQRLVRGEWRMAPLLHDIFDMGTDPLPPIVRKWVREDRRD
jgi:predicted ATP-grasp superfamily ATP-dependent carboligase